MNLDVPPWVETYIRAWADRLGLLEWIIKVKIALTVNDDADTNGLCEQFPDINTAIITLRADIEDTVEWRKVIIHEMLHVQHARIDHYIEDAMIPELAAAAQQLGRQVYHHHVESYVHLLTTTLYRATCGVDYPEENRDEPPKPTE